MAEFGDSGSMMNLYAGSEAQPSPPKMNDGQSQGESDLPVAIKTEPVRRSSRVAAIASSSAIKREKSVDLPSGIQSEQTQQSAAVTTVAAVSATSAASAASAVPAVSSSAIPPATRRTPLPTARRTPLPTARPAVAMRQVAPLPAGPAAGPATGLAATRQAATLPAAGTASRLTAVPQPSAVPTTRLSAVSPATLPTTRPTAVAPAATAAGFASAAASAAVDLPVLPTTNRASRVKQEPTASTSFPATPRGRTAGRTSPPQIIELFSSDDSSGLAISSGKATINSSSPPPAAAATALEKENLEMMDILDHRGDLIVQIPSKTPLGTPSRFRVCSRTLYRASAFLEREYNRDESPARFLSRQNDKSGKTAIKKIVLPNDVDPKAFGVVLRIIHGKLTEINMHLRDLALFNEVLALTHKLKMDNCLIPIAAKWLKRVYDNDATRFDELGPQLWITHQLGRTRLLKQTILAVVVGGRVNPDGELLGFGAADEQPFVTLGSLRNVPELIYDITRARAAVMETLIDLVNASLDRLVASSASRPVCCALVHHLRCDCTMLGAFERSLFSAGWTRALMVDDGTVRVRPPLVDLRSSPRQLHKKIKSIVGKTVAVAVSTSAHANCDPWGGQASKPFPSIEELVKNATAEVRIDEEAMKVRSDLMGFDEE